MLNRVQLIGNVGADPIVKDFETSRVASFSVATTEKGFTTKDGRDIPERTEWHNIVIWGGLTKVVEAFVRKGSRLYLEGKLRHRNYVDTAGVKRFVSEVYADNMILMDKPQQTTPVDQQSAPVQDANEGPTDFVGPDGEPIDKLPF